MRDFYWNLRESERNLRDSERNLSDSEWNLSGVRLTQIANITRVGGAHVSSTAPADLYITLVVGGWAAGLCHN